MTETTERQEQVGIRLTPEQAQWLDRRAARGFGGRAVIVRALIDQAMAEERRNARIRKEIEHELGMDC
jgi:metal-responsive CopG/Arc/MetJ family transcriptional regulator